MKYTLEGQQPLKDGEPVKISVLVKDLNNQDAQIKKLIEHNAQLHKDKMKYKILAEGLLRDGDEGEEE